jgi:Putative zinc-finger
MDEVMMDWLYEELDPPRSARVSEHLESCPRCSEQLGALRSTRAALRDLPQVEPPPAISAILIHEAARRAPAVEAPDGVASHGFWHRLRAAFRPLVLHPAAAAIASLILVAGVAGALYVRSAWDIGDPHAIPDQGPMAAREPVADAPADLDGKPAGAVGAAESRAPQSARPKADGVAAQLLEGEEEADLRAATSPRREAERKQRFASKPKQAPADEPQKSAAEKGASSGGSDPMLAVERGDQPAANTVSGAGPAAPPPAAELADEDKAQEGRTKTLEKTQGWLQVQEQKLTALARNKRCREAAAVANDILDRDPAYYAHRVRDSKEVELCRSYVGNEQRRRAAARQSQSPKGGAGAPPQTKAAPQPEEAADTGQ